MNLSHIKGMSPESVHGINKTLTQGFNIMDDKSNDAIFSDIGTAGAAGLTGLGVAGLVKHFRGSNEQASRTAAPLFYREPEVKTFLDPSSGIISPDVRPGKSDRAGKCDGCGTIVGPGEKGGPAYIAIDDGKSMVDTSKVQVNTMPKGTQSFCETCARKKIVENNTTKATTASRTAAPLTFREEGTDVVENKDRGTLTPVARPATSLSSGSCNLCSNPIGPNAPTSVLGEGGTAFVSHPDGSGTMIDTSKLTRGQLEAMPKNTPAYCGKCARRVMERPGLSSY